MDQRVRLEWRKPSIGEEALPGRGPRGFIRFPSLYREAWARARDKRPHHRALSDEFLWHDVYNFYVENSPLLALSAEAERSTIEVSQDGHDAARTVLVEALYGNVRPIAGEIATKRFPSALWPSQRTIPKAAKHAYDGQRDRIHELASVGIFGLIIAADRFSPKYGRFWTYAKYWVEKYMLLYAEEMVGVIPRTGDMGIEEEGKNDEGEDWVVYKPRRSVMDLIEVALAGERSYRGKASGGMAMFDAGLLLEGVVTNDCVKLPDFEFLSTEGPTREYLQRRVSNKLYPWIDNGTHAVPRLTLPGHAGGKASDKPPIDLGYEPDPVEEIELPDKPVTRKRARPLTLGQSPRMADGGGTLLMYGPSARQAEIIADCCYLAKQRPDRQHNSWDKFGSLQPLRPKLPSPSAITSGRFNPRVGYHEYCSRERSLTPSRMHRVGFPPKRRLSLSDHAHDVGVFIYLIAPGKGAAEPCARDFATDK